MLISILSCLASFVVLILLLRTQRHSFGLPIAYLFALLFIHVPGAVAHLVGSDYLSDTKATRVGIYLTAIAAATFVVGVALARFLASKKSRNSIPRRRVSKIEFRHFTLFCLIAGLTITYTLSLVVNIPSIGAIIEKGGAVWVLGALLGLRSAVKRANGREIVFWATAICIFPVLTLLLGGFLSFGSTPVFIILSALVVSTRSRWRVAFAIPVVALFFFTLFLSYFQSRNDIRDAVWGGENMETRISESGKIFTRIAWFDPDNEKHLDALDQRLNQNFFVGRSAERIEEGLVKPLRGRTFYEGLISLVPRIIWPSKPVVAGSPKIIMEMTGFMVNDSTSYGVGNVMEFYINFGTPSLVIGFLLLGFSLGWLDYHAAIAVGRGQFGLSILFFMPAVAMIHPNGSVVELMSGGVASCLAAVVWRWLWSEHNERRSTGSSNQVDRRHRVDRAGKLRQRNIAEGGRR